MSLDWCCKHIQFLVSWYLIVCCKMIYFKCFICITAGKLTVVDELYDVRVHQKFSCALIVVFIALRMSLGVSWIYGIMMPLSTGFCDSYLPLPLNTIFMFPSLFCLFRGIYNNV